MLARVTWSPQLYLFIFIYFIIMAHFRNCAEHNQWDSTIISLFDTYANRKYLWNIVAGICTLSMMVELANISQQHDSFETMVNSGKMSAGFHHKSIM